MGYKFKPNKGVAKRMKVTATGKLKHRHEKLSHLRSNRTGKLKRSLGRPEILAEGHSRNMRRFLGLVGKRPKQAVHEKALAAAEKAEAKS
jgi:large subunit ribosomal protein L35